MTKIIGYHSLRPFWTQPGVPKLMERGGEASNETGAFARLANQTWLWVRQNDFSFNISIRERPTRHLPECQTIFGARKRDTVLRARS